MLLTVVGVTRKYDQAFINHELQVCPILVRVECVQSKRESKIDSVMKVTTICFCSRVILCNSVVYGAIGVSLILCANVVIILSFLVSAAKVEINYHLTK